MSLQEQVDDLKKRVEERHALVKEIVVIVFSLVEDYGIKQEKDLDDSSSTVKTILSDFDQFTFVYATCIGELGMTEISIFYPHRGALVPIFSVSYFHDTEDCTLNCYMPENTLLEWAKLLREVSENRKAIAENKSLALAKVTNESKSDQNLQKELRLLTRRAEALQISLPT